MSKVYIATFSANAVEEAKKHSVNLELNDICISENLDPESFDATVDAMKREIEESGAEDAIMHGPFTEIIPGSIDHRFVRLGLERLNEAYDACQAMGINRMVVHTGYEPLMYFKEWHLKRSVEFWRTYMEDKGDFHIYIENVFDDEPLMMKNLIDALDDPRIKVCMDVGHANAVTKPEYDVYKWIEVLGPRIGHFHLHNNDGSDDEHRPLLEGSMDMGRVLDCVEKYCDSDVTFTIESRECGTSIEWLKGRVDK